MPVTGDLHAQWEGTREGVPQVEDLIQANERTEGNEHPTGIPFFI